MEGAIFGIFWVSPSKRAFERYKPRGLFSEFYGIFADQVSLDPTSYGIFVCGPLQFMSM